MTAKEMAELLNGREYGNEITSDEEKLAKESGLVVVFGYSDDNCEFRGAIDDEVGCYCGGEIHLTKDGIIELPGCGLAYADACEYYKAAVKSAKKILAVWDDWGDAEDPATWSYETEIPHETFNIYDAGELYCVGIVFNIADLEAETA